MSIRMCTKCLVEKDATEFCANRRLPDGIEKACRPCRKKQRGALYVTWLSMIGRCHSPRRHDFARYGGRGITVCDRWRGSYLAFCEDMGPKPTPQHSIDRVDGSRGYEPSNCKWATMEEQQKNRKFNGPRVEIGGESLTLSEWSRRTGLKVGTILTRIKLGWSADMMLSPARQWRRRSAPVTG